MAHRSLARLRLVAVLATICAFAFVSGPASATVTFTTDEAAWTAANAGLVDEDFEDINVPPSGVAGCPAPANSGSANACFDPGDISAGISIRDEGTVPDPAFALAIAGPPFPTVPNKVIVANYFVETFVVEFSPAVSAAGLTLVQYFAGGPCTVVVTTAGPGGSSAATCSNAGSFLGINSDEGIAKIEIKSGTGSAEGLSRIRFGTPSTCAGSAAEAATGSAINETGPVSGTVHNDVEPAVGPAEPVVHEVSCVVAAAGL